MRFPGVVDAISKREQEPIFIDQMRECLHYKLNFGWASQKDYTRYMGLKKNPKAIE